MPSKYDPCKKGCCWNPYLTCSKGRTCACHIDAREYEAFTEGNFNPTPKPAANVAPLFQEPTP